jgi:hypothetical protein
VKPQSVDQISLSPAHYENLKKRGRKPKTISGDSSVKEKHVTTDPEKENPESQSQ